MLITKEKIINTTLILSLFVVPLVIYVHNLSPSIYGGDSGDFATAIVVKGVPHPSGYPLYTLLGILFNSLPIDKTPAWKIGLVSSIFAALGVLVTYLIAMETTSKKRIISVITAFSMAFLYPYWLYAETVEIFSMHYFFILTIILFALLYIRLKKKKYLYFLTFTIALSLTNNLSAILIIPIVILAITLAKPKNEKFLDPRFIITNLLLFLLGLSAYLYIPIAASTNPPLNWGNAVNIRNLINLILRKNYSWGTLSNFNTPAVSANILIYLKYWLIHVNLLFIIIIFFGIYFTYKQKKYITLLLLAASFTVFGPFYIIYSKYDLANLEVIGIQERFYTSSIIILFLFFPLGAEQTYSQINQKVVKKLKYYPFRRLVRLSLLIILILIPSSTFHRNYPSTNFNDNYLGDVFATDLLEPLPKNSTVWVAHDTVGFNALYLQHALKKRGDINIPGHYGSSKNVLIQSGYLETPSEKNIQEHYLESGNWLNQNIKYSSLAPIIHQSAVFADHKIDIVDDVYGNIISIPYGLLFKIEFRDNYDLTIEEYLNTINPILENLQTEYLTKSQKLIDNSFHYAHINYFYSQAYLNVAEFLVNFYNDKEYFNRYLQTAEKLKI